MWIKVSNILCIMVGLFAISKFTAAEQKTQSDLAPAASEKLFDLSSWLYRNPTYNRPYYPGGYPGGGYPNRYYPNSGYYPTGGGYYPSSGGGYYPNTYPGQYYPNYNTGIGGGYGGYGGAGGGGYGGYGGYGGNGGLTTYYGYNRDDYDGNRNRGFGYQQHTTNDGFYKTDDRNRDYSQFSNYY